MAHRTNDTSDDGAGLGDVEERARLLTDTFGVSPETARASSADNAAGGMRKPASDEVERERIASANDEAETSTTE